MSNSHVFRIYVSVLQNTVRIHFYSEVKFTRLPNLCVCIIHFYSEVILFVQMLGWHLAFFNSIIINMLRIHYVFAAQCIRYTRTLVVFVSTLYISYIDDVYTNLHVQHVIKVKEVYTYCTSVQYK